MSDPKDQLQKDHLRDIFRAAGRRLTSHRCLILAVLEESDAHLDADKMAALVRYWH